LWGVSLGGVAAFGYISRGGERWRVQRGGCVRWFSEVGIQPRPVVGLGYVAGVASPRLAISPGVERAKGAGGSFGVSCDVSAQWGFWGFYLSLAVGGVFDTYQSSKGFAIRLG
jgi:hypothetical protein